MAFGLGVRLPIRRVKDGLLRGLPVELQQTANQIQSLAHRVLEIGLFGLRYRLAAIGDGATTEQEPVPRPLLTPVFLRPRPLLIAAWVQLAADAKDLERHHRYQAWGMVYTF
jgi:hypothetical protein